MNKIELINKFLEKVDLKPHELVYWKHKVSSGFDLIKFMSDFLDYAESEQLRQHFISQQRELLEAYQHFIDWNEEHDRKASTSERIEAFLVSNCG